MMRRFGRGRGFELAVAHGSYDLAMAARSLGIPGSEHARLRVRGHPAPHRVPAGNPRDLSRFRPRGAAAAVRGGAREAVPVPGLEGGVLPGRLRARPRCARAARRRHAASGGHRPASARHLAVPPQVEPALPPGPLPARKRPAGSRRRPAPHRRSAKLREAASTCRRSSSPNGRSKRRAWSRWPTWSSPREER